MKKVNFSKLLEILLILEQEHFDVKAIQVTKKCEDGKYYYIKLKDIIQEGHDIQDIITKYKLDENYPYGRRKSEFDGTYHGTNAYPITEEERKKGERFVVETSTERLLRILEILQKEKINIRKIKLNKMRDGKQVSTTIGDIKQNGIDIDEIIKKYNLDSEYKIGIEITRLRQAYNGNKPCARMTNRDIERAKKLGIVYDKKERKLEVALDILYVLQREGVDINSINIRKGEGYTTLKDIKQEGINIEDIIKRNGLDRNYEIGRYIRSLKPSSKGKSTYAMTKTDIERSLELFDEHTNRGAEKLFEVLELLRAEGVDINRIKKVKKVGEKHTWTTLMDIKQDGINMEEIIKRHSLDRNYKIGLSLSWVQTRYNGTAKRQMTNEERKRADKLGVFKTKKRPIEQLLDILEVLSNEGIDVSKIHQTKRVIDGKEKSTTLLDIRQNGINIIEIIKLHNLDACYPIGSKITKFRQGYKGKNDYFITDDDRRRGEKLGIVHIEELEAEQRKLQEKLSKAKKLEKEAEMQYRDSN